MAEIESGRLLIMDKPLQVLPQLAFAIGLNEAMVLQQVHYWVKINARSHRNKRLGYYWMYNTYEQWQKDNFPFWSKGTIKRTIHQLEDRHLLVGERLDKNPFNRTKWYRVDYDVLRRVGTSYGFVLNSQEDLGVE
jgi:hypothetical protein